MPLDLSSFRKSVLALERAIAVATPEKMSALDDDTREVLKAGVIQSFEFTYEITWKFLKRWLEVNVSPSAADGVTRRELFRLAAENRLILDVEQWMKHHNARNQTSHIYDPQVADSVFGAAHEFARDAKKVLLVLEARND